MPVSPLSFFVSRFQRLARRGFAPVAAFALACAGDARAQATDSLLQRLDEARRMLTETAAELDSLRLGVSRLAVSRAPDRAGPSYAPADSSIWREVLAEKRRRAELEAAFEYRRASLGYTFNPNLVLGMNGTAWQGDWGLKADGRVSLVDKRRAWGANLSLLYAIHQFYLTGEEMYTRLYAFAGSGFYWERKRGGAGGWYDLADQAVRTQLGAGTELGLREMHGTRIIPEIGFQHSYFRARHQESGDYVGDRPRSDFSLYPYYAIHINFYFL